MKTEYSQFVCTAVQKVTAVFVFPAAGLNTYPPSALKKSCDLVHDQQEEVIDGYACYCSSQVNNKCS